jgi:phytoene synthase
MHPEAVATAYRHCRAVAREHGRTYYLATSLLPGDRRPHVWALYAFARTADDLVDHPGADPAGDLASWERRALGGLRAPSPPDPVADPVTAATWHTMRAFGLDVALWEEFARSMRMDLTVDRYPTFADLRQYMRGSAAVIGELMAPVLGAEERAALPPAGRLGEAFQLTNFVRDVAEDLARGRIYLPLEDLSRAGVAEDDLRQSACARRPTPAVAALVDLEVDRALALYDEARPGIALTAPWARPCLEAAFVLYRDIALAIRARGGDVFSGRVTVPRRRRARVAVPLLGRALWHRGRSTRRT